MGGRLNRTSFPPPLFVFHFGPEQPLSSLLLFWRIDWHRGCAPNNVSTTCVLLSKNWVLPTADQISPLTMSTEIAKMTLEQIIESRRKFDNQSSRICFMIQTICFKFLCRTCQSLADVHHCHKLEILDFKQCSIFWPVLTIKESYSKGKNG